MGNSWAEYFKESHLRRLKKQNHRPCKVHHRDTEVCEGCLKVVCARCGHECTPIGSKRATHVRPEKPKRIKVKRQPVPDVPYEPTPALKPVWKILSGMGAVRIEAHTDSGHWMAVFPKMHFNVHTAAELADRVWQDPKLRLIAKPTAFRAGRLQRPEVWWVSFELKRSN
jgi:hypothetical protein